MKYMDIKTQPKTKLEVWLRWMNWTQTRLVLMCGNKVPIIKYNEQGWEFAAITGGWHLHDHEICDKCTILAVF